MISVFPWNSDIILNTMLGLGQSHMLSWFDEGLSTERVEHSADGMRVVDYE